MSPAQLLEAITAELRRSCPAVPPGLDHRLVAISYPRRLAQIWFRTRGCRYRVRGGGCSVCDYGASSIPAHGKMKESVAAAVSELPFEPRTLVVSASGSFLDPWEVPLEERADILELLARRLPATHVILETHASTITHETLSFCAAILRPGALGIELGLECANPLVLRLCLNKKLTLSSFRRALSTVASFPNLRTTANVLVGIPVFTSVESSRCALATIEWALYQKVDDCVLFPVNIRPSTLAQWLTSHALWSAPTLWDLVDVLIHVPIPLLSQVNIAWYAPDQHVTSSSPDNAVAPTTCPRCYSRVVTVLAEYADAPERAQIRERLADLNCTCKVQWESHRRGARPLRDRLLETYERMTIDLLGREVWRDSRDQLIEELAVLDGWDPQSGSGDIDAPETI